VHAQGLRLDRSYRPTGPTAKATTAGAMAPLHAVLAALIRAEVPALAEHGEIGGGHNRADNISSGHGTSATYALSRLKRDRPDLAEEVVAGRKSANAAAIEAGFRKRTITVPDDMEDGCHGWSEREFGWAERTAQNFMNTAISLKSATVADLPIDAGALYLLAEFVPEHELKAVLARAQAEYRGQGTSTSAQRL
jgi:hypothetical protein